MGKISTAINISNVTNLNDLLRFLSPLLIQIQSVINGNVEFESNIFADQINVSFSGANVETRTPHNLGRVPFGYFLIGSNAAVQIYNTTASDKNFIYPKASAKANVSLMVI